MPPRDDVLHMRTTNAPIRHAYPLIADPWRRHGVAHVLWILRSKRNAARRESIDGENEGVRYLARMRQMRFDDYLFGARTLLREFA